MEEFDNIKAMITTVFSFLGIAHEEIRTEAGGKILMKADIPDAKYSCVASGLFGRGIVIVKAGSGEWGFAVRG